MGRKRRDWTKFDYYVLVAVLLGALILGFITDV